MKTEEQILLNYMYMNGYTDEDMHDPKALKIVRESLSFSMHILAARAKAIFVVIGQSLKAAYDHISEQLRPIAVWFEEQHEISDSGQIKTYPTLKNTAKRPMSRMSHQVMNNKPRHAVRKIIR